MIYHTRMVRAGVRRALVIIDLPFLTYQVSIEEAKRNAGRAMQLTGANGVKLEGGLAIRETVRALVDIGIPVMGHVGFTPPSVHAPGGGGGGGGELGTGGGGRGVSARRSARGRGGARVKGRGAQAGDRIVADA